MQDFIIQRKGKSFDSSMVSPDFFTDDGQLKSLRHLREILIQRNSKVERRKVVGTVRKRAKLKAISTVKQILPENFLPPLKRSEIVSFDSNFGDKLKSVQNKQEINDNATQQLERNYLDQVIRIRGALSKIIKQLQEIKAKRRWDSDFQNFIPEQFVRLLRCVNSINFQREALRLFRLIQLPRALNFLLQQGRKFIASNKNREIRQSIEQSKKLKKDINLLKRYQSSVIQKFNSYQLYDITKRIEQIELNFGELNISKHLLDVSKELRNIKSYN